MKKILSIDGGGIRGVIPAMVLEHLEQKVGVPIYQMFDLIAGTSTGGILALGLTKPRAAHDQRPTYSASDMIRLYSQQGPQIFDNSFWHRVQSAWGMGEEKYVSKGIESVLKKTFGRTRLKAALTPVLIPAYEIEQRKAFFFKSLRAGKEGYDNFPMWQVARSTSAAPTYFEPAKLKSSGDSTNRRGYVALIDGGMFANNPAMCAYVEAKTLFPDEEEFLIVSLGTGEYTRSIPYNDAINWGIVAWAPHLLGVTFDGVSDTVSYQLQQIIPQGRYYRFQVRLPKQLDAMDKTKTSHIKKLQQLANQMLKKNKKELVQLVEKLRS